MPGESEAKETTLVLLGDQTQLGHGAHDRGKCSRLAWNFPRNPETFCKAGIPRRSQEAYRYPSERPCHGELSLADQLERRRDRQEPSRKGHQVGWGRHLGWGEGVTYALQG